MVSFEKLFNFLSFSGLTSEDIAARIYLFVYPTCLLFSSGYFPFWQRYGFRWQVLCISPLICMALIIVSPAAWYRFCLWFKKSCFIWLSPAAIVWLIIMGMMHGWSGSNLEGLLSGFYLLMVSPFVVYTMILSRLKYAIFGMLFLYHCAKRIVQHLE